MRLNIDRASWLGLACVIGLLTLLVLGFTKPRISGHEDVVRVTFRDAAAIARFDRDVRVGGANLGTIGSVTRQGSHAVVELRFPAGAVGPVHTDATAELRPHLVFDGTAYVAFSPGSASAPLLGGRTLGLDHTRDFVSLERALRVLDGGTRNDLQGALSDLANTLRAPQAAALHRTFAGQPRLFASLAPAMRALQGSTREELTGAIRGYARTVDGLAQERSSLGPLLRSSERTLRGFRVGADVPYEQTLAALPAALEQSASGGAALEGTVNRLEPLAADLQPGLRELGPVLVAARPVLAAARPVLAGTPGFVADLRATLGAGARATPPTRAALRRLDPTLDTLSSDLLPFLRSRPSGDIPVYRRLAAVAANAGATMSAVRSPEAAAGVKAGPGHGWHHFTASLSGSSGHPTCASVAAPLRPTLQSLGLCIG